MPSIIQADQLKSADGSTTYLNSGTLSNLTFPAGHVLQVQSTTKTGVVSIADSTVDSPQDITGMSVSITPKTTTSQFFVTFTANIGGAAGDNILLTLVRNSTNIGVGVDNSGTVCSTETDRFSNYSKYSVNCVTFSFLDDPSLSDLSAITYKLKWTRTYSGAGSAFLNKSGDRAAESDRADTASTITVIEIAG